MTLHSSPVPFTLANDMPYSLELRVLVDTHLGAPAQLKQASKRPGKKSSQRRSSKTRMRIFRPTNSSTSRLQPSQASSALQCARQAQVSHVLYV
jgi:hypothetical protein